MAQTIKENLQLNTIIKQEISAYIGTMLGTRLYPVFDDHHQTYGIVAVPDNIDDRPAWMILFLRVQGDLIIIEEDTAIDKPLSDALIHNGGIPRERIVLAYKGETLPEAD